MIELKVYRSVVETILAETRRWGSRPAETGAFLLAPASHPDRISILALAGDAGIRRSRDLFQVTGPAVEQLFAWAGDGDLRVRAQVHSHRGDAFLSVTDLRHGFNVEGFVTSVIPDYGTPPVDPTQWGWWEFGHGAWRPRAAPLSVAGPADILVFDAHGVRRAS